MTVDEELEKIRTKYKIGSTYRYTSKRFKYTAVYLVTDMCRTDESILRVHVRLIESYGDITRANWSGGISEAKINSFDVGSEVFLYSESNSIYKAREELQAELMELLG